MFFNNFPLIDYDINATEEYVLATNIMKRFRIRRSVVDNRSFYYNYELQDNERPEVLAYKFYGKSDLHWLIMMTNNIRDPYIDWPIDQHALEQMVEKKYPGTSLFLWNAESDWPAGPYKEPHMSQFKVGDEIEWVDVDIDDTGDETITTITKSGVKATVLKWDAQYMRLIISDMPDWPTSKYISNNTQGIPMVAYNLKTVAKSSQAIHHWEESYTLPGTTTVVKNMVNPMDLDRTTSNNADVPEEDATRRYRDAYIEGQTSLSFTLSSPPITKNLKVITNDLYEVAKNDEKRKIKIIKPEFVEDILSDFKKVFNT